ncbi:MAG: 30S ribosomal protein S12 methylthiotransferase RimO [Acidobacteria bacterium]|nr:MAG: 30S ribosomal protein S12 methylthiotransferase RimO [Acidobacteriota bacterium]REK02123.1 MAG: 30S ribosomal protein S12 methylthiotransferase RimO [Acidobacteriota bacterium]REK14075.1 MAG: 30S ribosomal protein S12 methylthiotransferase RimO [Acidobacteriota bacterium]REK42070.1 MAG: 30S ribosomal protein S12 methylthiotransferase RimO [Acidobacteriota bacterium]
MKKVGFVSLGCPKNLVDSEVMMGQLKEAGYEITNDAGDADTVVVNTCGFIESAKEESVEAILEATGLKQKGKAKRVVVAGCLVERYRDELIDELPEVDAFIGTNEVNRILEATDETKDFRSLPLHPIGNKSATYLYDEYTPRLRATDSHTAFIKIAEGCDRPCAFCSIPSMRGSFRSRRFGSIMEEAQHLAKQGVKEIVLIAQDSSRYGEDLGDIDGLAILINELCTVDGLDWVRVMYTYPTHISDGFLEAIANNEKAVKYLDMPLQHASRNVLKAMKRGGTRESLERLITRVREAVPGIAIRTTFIVGYPGESEEDFEELMQFVRNCEFDNVGVFTYSDEEGTPAFELPNKVDPKVASDRRKRLMKEQARISRRKNEQKIGSVFRVMFEGVSKESDLLWQGRLEGQAQEIDGYILINDAPEGRVPAEGEIVNVEITEAHEYDLVGRIV